MKVTSFRRARSLRRMNIQITYSGGKNPHTKNSVTRSRDLLLLYEELFVLFEKKRNKKEASHEKPSFHISDMFSNVE